MPLQFILFCRIQYYMLLQLRPLDFPVLDVPWFDVRVPFPTHHFRLIIPGNIVLYYTKSRTISTWLTEAAFFIPHCSKGKASCVPPERHLIIEMNLY